MTPQEITDELARLAQRYKMDEDRRRVRMVAAPEQKAGNAQAVPEMPQSGPDLDEYAYVGSPSPPVTRQEQQFRPMLATEHGQGPYPPLRAPGLLDPRTATPVPAGYTYGDDGITRDPNGVPAMVQSPSRQDIARDVSTAASPGAAPLAPLLKSTLKGAQIPGMDPKVLGGKGVSRALAELAAEYKRHEGDDR
jgi:hypothetical protein